MSQGPGFPADPADTTDEDSQLSEVCRRLGGGDDDSNRVV